MGDVVKITCWGTVKELQPDGTIIERRCKAPPMKGQRVCQTHGGMAPQSRAKGSERIAVGEAKDALLRFGVPVAGDPREILLDQLYQANGNVFVLKTLLEDVKAEDVADDDPQTRARARGLLNLYAEWQDRAAALAVAATRAGLEERVVRVAESQIETFVKLVRESLDEALEPAQRDKVLQVVAGKMRALVA